MLDDWMLYVAATVAAFISTLLRGFQNKNVVGGYTKLAFVTGYLMAVADATIVGLIVTVGVYVVLVSGIGAGFGYVASMWLHKKFTKKHEKERKKHEKEKQRSRMEKMIRQYMETNNQSQER